MFPFHLIPSATFTQDFESRTNGIQYPWDANSEDDKAACQRRLEFWIGWFADPIYFGDYPESMKKQLGDRLPKITPEERALIKGSNDFYGMVRIFIATRVSFFYAETRTTNKSICLL